MSPDPKPARPDGRPLDHRWPAVLFGFARIGATSFGGGSATTMAMRTLTLKRGWLSESEFLDTVVLSRLTPGITILAQAMLIGRAVCGVRGLLAAMAGLMTPAVVITVTLAQLYDLIARLPGSTIPLRAVAGMAAGFAVAMAVTLLRDTLVRAHRWRGPLLFAVYLGCAFLIDNPLIILGGAIALGVLFPKLFASKNIAETGEPEAAPEEPR